jgi:microcystin-dependent protein
MDPFVAEIRIFGFNFAPKGWAFCDGGILPISQNTALFALLGTTYGGNGTANFALPNLQGRVPMHPDQGPGLSLYDLGQTVGVETVTLTTSELPAHTHALQGVNAAATESDPTGLALALPSTLGAKAYATGTPTGAGAPSSIFGGGQPHNNLQPSLVLNFCIALQGVFPPRW